MKIRFLLVLSVFIIFFSCNKKENTTIVNDEEQENSGLTEKELSKLNYVEFALDSRTKMVIDDHGWEAYYQILDVVTNVKKADLSFFNDNNEAITVLLKDLREGVPTKLNKPATLARISAFETKLYKLESLSNLHTTTKKELTNTVKEFLEAFSNLNFQMNKKIENDENIKVINEKGYFIDL